MPIVLVSSRSFAQIAQVGEEILRRGGFAIRRVDETERPLNASNLARLVSKERPSVLLAGAEPVSAGVLRASTTLRMVQKHGVGVDNIDLGAATEAGIVVANAPGTNSDAVADLTLALMLSLLRQLTPAIESTRSGRWDRFVGRELGRLTVGVVGTGRVGRAVIQRLRGFGSQILAHDVVEVPQLSGTPGVRYVPLSHLLHESDIVTLHIPLTDETRNLIGEANLAAMKKAAFLVNVARGELVDEPALARHLSAGHIAGAAIDVFATEPPQESPLLRLDNVLATPHIAAYTVEAMEAMDAACAQTILNVFARRPAENVVNPEVLKQWVPD